MDFSLVFYKSEDILYTNDTQKEDYLYAENQQIAKYKSITLNGSDINRIKSGWFNDNLVDFFTLYFFDQLKEEDKNKIYIFGSSYYNILRNPSHKTKKSIFDIDKINTIIMPICLSCHFSLAIFHNLLTVHNAVTEKGENDIHLPPPVIICLDPLRIHSVDKIAKDLRNFYVTLLNIYLEERNIETVNEIFTRLVLPRLRLQDNASDCGAYILSYFRYFINHMPTITESEIDSHLEEWSSSYDRWENPSTMRLELMNIINKIQIEEVKKNK